MIFYVYLIYYVKKKNKCKTNCHWNLVKIFLFPCRNSKNLYDPGQAMFGSRCSRNLINLRTNKIPGLAKCVKRKQHFHKIIYYCFVRVVANTVLYKNNGTDE